MKVYYLLIIAIIAIFAPFVKSFSQNQIWSLPSVYVPDMANVGQPLPLPDPGNPLSTLYDPGKSAYDGSPAIYAHNSMPDSDGNLRFFIIDGKVYNKDGFLLDEFLANGDVSLELIRGYNEFTIVPFANNCNKYYIIGSYIKNQNNWGMFTGVFTFEENSPYNTHLRGRFEINPENGLNSTNLSNTFQSLSNDLKIQPQPNNIYANFTPLRADGSRLLFVCNWGYLFCYEVTDAGIVPKQVVSSAYRADVPYLTDFYKGFGEMDVIEYNGGYRISWSFNSELFDPFGPQQYWSIFEMVDTDLEGNRLRSGIVSYQQTALHTVFPDVTGYETIRVDPSFQAVLLNDSLFKIEFPDSMEYHSRLILNQKGEAPSLPNSVINQNLMVFAVFDTYFDTLSNSFQDADTILFYKEQQFLGPTLRGSHIEKGIDNNFYISNGQELAGYNQVNLFINTNISLNPTYNSPDPNFFNYQYRALPNQTIGESYTSPFTSSCCIDENQVFKTYTATLAGDSWSAFSSPFFNPNTIPFQYFDEIVITDSLTFAPGSITTLQNFKIMFEPGAKMIIGRGAKVILNNSILTSRDCSKDLWEGVIVYGNPSISHAFPTNHGQLIVENNSEISNAVRGVRAFGTIDVVDPITGEISMQPDFSNSGGIVQVSNSLFKNNKKDVEFYPYNFRNISYFNNTSFITDALLIDGSSPDTHLSLFGVRTIKVRGCTFENSTSGIYLNENLLGFGITAYESSFSVEAFNGNIRTSFDKLFYGIYASNANPLATSSVIDADFSDCFNGLYFNNVDYSIIERCQFDVNNPFQSINVPYGVYLQNSTGYKVANNDFITQTTNGDTRGMLINNSNENGTSWDANAIFNNKFTGLNHASWAFNSNVGEFSLLGNTSIITGSGLLFKCNVYNLSIESDIMITRGGIRKHQGSCSTPTSGANNYFTPNYTPLIGDFWNNNNLPTLYTNQYFANPYNGVIGTTLIDEYNPVNTTNLNCNTPLDINKACKEDYPKSISRLLALSDSVKTAGQAKDNFYTALDSYVNNQWSLYQSGQLSVGNLKNNLLTKSPYLPTHILEAIIQSNMAPGIKKQLLLDNSPLPQNVVLLVQQSNLPNGIKNQILNGQNGGTNPRILVNAETEDLIAESKLTMNEAVRYYLHDTTVVNGLDSAIVLLKMRSEIIYRKQLADAYIENKQFFQAQNLIDSLKLVDNGAHLEFAKMRELLIAFEQCQEKGFRIMHDSTQRVQLESIKTNDNIRRECMSAQVIFDMVNKTKFDEEIPFIIVPKSYTPTPQNLTSASQMASIYVYPNPANDFLTVELMDETENAVITIYSILGSVMKTIRVNQSIQQIDVSDLEVGIYLVTSTLSDGSISTERIVIER